MGYRPDKEAGARCSTCPLGPSRTDMPWSPVRSEVKESAAVAVVALCPADTETRIGRPLVGESGIMFDQLLQEAGHSRKEVTLHNLLSCQPPGQASGAFERLEQAVKRRRAAFAAKLREQHPDWKATRAKREAERLIPHAHDCCRPRLRHDLKDFSFVIPLGRIPWQLLTGDKRAIGTVRGGPFHARYSPIGPLYDLLPESEADRADTWLLPTNHPSSVLRNPASHDMVRRDLSKAWRHFTNSLQWVDPERTVCESPEQLRQWLSVPSPFWAVDTETSGIDPLICTVEMIQIATPDLDKRGRPCSDQYAAHIPCRAIAVLFVDENGEDYWSDAELSEIQRLLRDFLEDPDRVKVGTNVGSYDRLVLTRSRFRRHHYLVARIRGIYDQLFNARFRAPDVPKGLKTQGRLFTDVGMWEESDAGDKISTGRNTKERIAYGQTDVAVNARIEMPLRQAAREAGSHQPLPADLKPREWDYVSAAYSVTPGSGSRAWNLHEVDHLAQSMCVEFHKIGLHVDQQERTRQEVSARHGIELQKKKLVGLAAAAGVGDSTDLSQLLEETDHDKEEAAAAAGVLLPDGSIPGEDRQLDDTELARLARSFVKHDAAAKTAKGKRSRTAGSEFNSYNVIRNLLYEDWDLDIPPGMEPRDFFTKTGLPGTSDAVIRAHLASGRLTEAQSAFLYQLRLTRRLRNKVLGGTLIPLRLRSEDPKKGEVESDGRFHPSWAAHVTAVGRLTANRIHQLGSRKGLGDLGKLFNAAEGHRLYGFDLNQAHLVIAANHWRIPRLLEAFTDGVDIHNLLAYDVEGDKFLNAPGWPPGMSKHEKFRTKPPPGTVPRALREFFKTLRYLLIYEGQTDTAWRSLQSTETADGELPYLNTPRGVVDRIRDRFLEVEPEWESQGWKQEKQLYKDNALKQSGSESGVGYINGPLSGRRSGVLDNGKPQKVVNYPILETESLIMRILEIRFMHAYPWQVDGPSTGLIAQIHDALKLELSMGRNPERTINEIEELATVEVPGWPIPFKVEAAYGNSIAEL